MLFCIDEVSSTVTDNYTNVVPKSHAAGWITSPLRDVMGTVYWISLVPRPSLLLDLRPGEEANHCFWARCVLNRKTYTCSQDYGVGKKNLIGVLKQTDILSLKQSRSWSNGTRDGTKQEVIICKGIRIGVEYKGRVFSDWSVRISVR